MTLLDVLVGLSIAVFLMTGLGVFVMFQNRKLSAETQTVAATQNLRAALEVLAGDLRAAGRRSAGVSYTAEASPPGICEAEAERIRITSDRDGDGTTTGPGEDVTYCLCRGSGAATVYRAYRPAGASGFVVEPIADRVDELRFTYSPRSVVVDVAVAVSTPLGTFSQALAVETFLRNSARAVSCASGAACPPTECSS